MYLAFSQVDFESELSLLVGLKFTKVAVYVLFGLDNEAHPALRY